MSIVSLESIIIITNNVIRSLSLSTKAKVSFYFPTYFCPSKKVAESEVKKDDFERGEFLVGFKAHFDPPTSLRVRMGELLFSILFIT